ncbi:MAG TPA: TolC family protein [Gemmatimonadota bacterium]|nr:TolC family protein [Gemmatimonadota bacterium]
MRRAHVIRPRAFFALVLAVTSALLAPAATSGAQEELGSVSHEEAIRLALERSPIDVAARGATRVAEAGVLEARGSWLPFVAANSTYSQSSNERFDQSTGQLTSESYTAQLTGAYDVFTGGRRIANWQAASASLRAAEALERGQRYATILETTRIFYQAAAGEELLSAARQRLERASRQQEFVETRRLIGTATRSDALRAELELADAEVAVLDAETQLLTSRLALGRQIGRPGAVRPEAGALPEVPPAIPPVEVLVERAERNAPDAVAARAELDRAESEKREVWGEYIPSLRLTGGYDLFSFDWPPDEESWNLRLTASFPVFNGFAREANMVRAEAERRTAEAEARDAVLLVRALVEDDAGRVDTATRRVEIARRALELAREDLRVIEERYQLGAATIIDLQTSQIALADAEVAWVRSRQELGVAVAALEADLGEPLSEVGS